MHLAPPPSSLPILPAAGEGSDGFALAADDARRVPTVDPVRLRHLTRLDGRRAALHIALEWTGIVAGAALAEQFFSPIVWALACVWIGSRLHALGIMAHDGTHGLLVPNRALNDLIVEVFLAWPVFLSLSRATGPCTATTTASSTPPAIRTGRATGLIDSRAARASSTSRG